MADKELSERGKWMISIYTALLFLLIANPLTFKLMNWLTTRLGFSIADFSGCPNSYGLIIHAIVFAILVRLMMLISLPGV